MDGQTGGKAGSRSGRRRGRSLALAASLLLHALVLGWFAVKQGLGAPPAELPAIEVQLVELPRPQSPPPSPPRTGTSRAPATRPSLPVEPRMTAPASGPPGKGSGPVDLYGPVFADGQWPRRGPIHLPPCDPAKDPSRTSIACRREDDVARGVTRAYDPQKNDGEFAREARHNEAVKRYHEAPGMAGYPGIGCAILHRC